jgi:very-short-patch-repair endonuclease
MRPEPLDTSRPFTTAQALAAGISAARLRGPEFRRLSKSKYVDATRQPSAVLDAEAALLGHPPDAFASHTTAARVYRMPVPHDAYEHVSVLDPARRRRRAGVLSHVAAPQTVVTTHRGVRVADPAHVFIALAATFQLVELVVVGDYIARQEWYSPARLVAVCAASTQAHARRAFAAARFVRIGVDSPMETRLRMLLVLAGFPEPQVNFIVRDARGSVLRRFDLCYPQVRVIVEYDGRQHAESPAQYDRDIYRREELDNAGW